MERMRRTDSSMRRLGLRLGQPAALEPEQRRDRLQVVLDPVVDLPDGGVLRHQQAVPTAELGDVAKQHERAVDPIGRHQGDAADDDRRLVALDLLDGRLTIEERPVGRRDLGAELGRASCPVTCSRTPTRRSADTALGDANAMRPKLSSRTTPSPTRGPPVPTTSSSAKGKMPSATMRARRSNTSR